MNIGEAGMKGMGVILAQRKKGVDKYGQTIEECNYTPMQLAAGAAEELADGLVYISEAIRRVERAPKLYVRLVDLQAMQGANHVAQIAVSAIQTEEFNVELIAMQVRP